MRNLLLFFIAIFVIFGSFPLHADDQFFPPQGCIPGRMNIVTWGGPGFPTRCIQIPDCQGGALQFTGTSFICSNDFSTNNTNTPTTFPNCIDNNCDVVAKPIKKIPTARVNCPAERVTWQVGDATCHGVIPRPGQPTQLAFISSEDPEASPGSATFTCEDANGRGVWVLSANPLCIGGGEVIGDPRPPEEGEFFN